MLKALELFGFKSFADRTRFEFPAGITVVVGPNGSGKSNIVDGIKWVLGEQSAKSLRGKDMADVIFKGSGTTGRKPMNAAEATLIFDNPNGLLPVDAPEVHITRRVYRSGEGEYLINRQPARLKDIRDMFRGTGVGADAYSMIEQGKVDRLLQASAKDRRAIFEEAAGISRFKAKKVEAQRRLERVDQNLLRLRDIVEEVENRLKAVRNQAAKAARYREYTQRLQELRTQVALADWEKFTADLEARQSRQAELDQQTAASRTQIEALEAQLLESETTVAACGEALRSAEAIVARFGEQIAQQEATLNHLRARLRELYERGDALTVSLSEMRAKLSLTQSAFSELQTELSAAEAAQHQAAAVAAEREAAFTASTTLLHALQTSAENARSRQLELVRQAAEIRARLQGEAKAQVAAEGEHSELRQALVQHEAEAHERLAALEAGRGQEAEHRADLAQIEAQAARSREILIKNRQIQVARQNDVAQLAGRRQVLQERILVLEDLERNYEGYSAGVRDALERAADDPHSNWGAVIGVAADLLQTDLEHAAAIDAALGDAAQHLVVAEPLTELSDLLSACAASAGRLTLLTAGEAGAELAVSDEDLLEDPDVLAHAPDVVETDARTPALAQILLGSVWLVRSRSAALRLASERPGQRFVTLEGDLASRGQITVGSRPAAASLVSRRSQLRAFQQELPAVERQWQDAQNETDHFRRLVEDQDEDLRRLVQSGHEVAKRLAEERRQIGALEAQSAQADSRRQDCLSRIAAAGERLAQLQASIVVDQERLAALDAELIAVQQTAARDTAAASAAELARAAAAQDATSASVELARAEQRTEALQSRGRQLARENEERLSAVSSCEAELDANHRRLAETEAAITAGANDIGLLYGQKETAQNETQAILVRRDEAAAIRQSCTEAVQTQRKTLRKAEEALRELEMGAAEVRHQRTTLAERLRDDYGIDLAAAAQERLSHDRSPSEAAAPGEAGARAEVEAEIETLRRKVNQIGAVNLDALEELDDLQQRAGGLSAQYNDLAEAKTSLERIIQRINADSRRLFLDTLEAIRVNFQALYRKAFGGGKADIALEEGVDVLECGVEIIATPPGKPSFNNSLLSGGEKALTAVALLLAIFKHRPSPFCVLDEVDAPFDEANIGRFVDVIREFLGGTRFVIVTHSKKTMTAANTLYGVTMQESGVSKRVSVRFEDVSDDGHIRREALDRAADEQTGAA